LSSSRVLYTYTLLCRLKCDRGQPCSTCAQRGLSSTCAYVQSASNRTQSRLTNNASAQERIGQLEDLVIQLMAKSRAEDVSNTTRSLIEPEGASLPGDSSQLSENFGRISVGTSGTSYVEGSHWTAIMDGVGFLFETIVLSRNPSY
jgi:hypothetical protein